MHKPTVPTAPVSAKVEESVHDLHGDSLSCSPDVPAMLPEEPPPKKHREMHLCNIHDKTFFSKSHLKRHQETIQHQSASFACRLCLQHFYWKDHLKIHYTRKRGNKEYETSAIRTCPICQTSFHYRAHFWEQLKTHQPTSPTVSHPSQSALCVDSPTCPVQLAASIPGDCWQCYTDNWSQIWSHQWGGRLF